MDCGRLSAAYLDMERPTPPLYPYFNNEFKILINHIYGLVCVDTVHYVLLNTALHMLFICRIIFSYISNVTYMHHYIVF